MEPQEVMEKFSNFLREHYYNELILAVSEGRKAILVDFNTLDKFDPELSDCLLEKPEEFLIEAEKAAKQVDLAGEAKLKIRFFNLPESKQIRIRNVRAEHIGKLIGVDGMVKRASEIRPEVSESIFVCPECGTKLTVIQTERNIRGPIECECGNRKGFRLVEEKLFDARWISIEEPFEITTGERPSSIMVFLKEDLTSPKMHFRTDPGNRIKVAGILKQLPKRIKGTRSRQLDIYLDANGIENLEIEWEESEATAEDVKTIKELASDPDIYQKVIRTIAPAVYGNPNIKEAIAFQLFGGVVHIQKDRSRVRGDINCLLVGDPSCLVSDERIVLADGTIMKIGEMGSSHLQKIDYRVHTGMGMKFGKATTFHLYKNQPIIEIITETGKSIKGTHNQPVLINENRKKIWKRLDEIKIREKVQVIPRILCNKKSLVETNWADYPYFHESWHIKIPKYVDKQLASLFGYIIADGWVEKRRIGFVVNEEEADIVAQLKEFFMQCFNSEVTSYKHSLASKKITYYQVNRTHLAKLLSFLNEKRVPDYIFKSGNKIVSAFLSWLYEGDGTVFAKGRGRTSVSLRSNNIELLRDVQLLLLRFGIHSRILWEEKEKTAVIKGRKISSRPSGNLMIRRSESIIKFYQVIGFVSKKKKEKLKAAVEYAKSHIHRIHKSLSEKIVKINKLNPQDVFDIEVPKHNRFIANGIVVHNTAKSVLMKVASTLMPRARYVSGKGVTGAGLTATVVKDEEFLGGWVLEAGAMVMCNKSLCCIDEFEKIDKSDQVALHEAMEQNTISIAKASIVATLPAQTAVLAGGNPKLGRFDPYVPIREQIDIPETLLTRFDLKFALRDIPNVEIDTKIADHILRSRHYGELDVKPEIDTELFKKYVSYARKFCQPILSRDAGEEIKNFFVSLRERATTGDSPVPITLRQYEALIRLAEASAKVQLRDTVTKEDAVRAINLMKGSLREFGFEPESGKFDIDMLEGRTSASQRSRIRIMNDLIEELTNIFGRDIPKEELIKRAQQEGVSEPEDLIRKMMNEGILFSPKPNILQKI